LRMVFDWSVCCWPLLWGVLLPCRNARQFRLAEAIVVDTHTVPHTTKGTQHA